MKVLARAWLRHGVRHPGRLAASVLGVGLGVAAAVGVDLAVGSARQALELSREAWAGRVTHRVTAGPAGVPDAVAASLRRLPGLAAGPVLEGAVAPLEGPAAGGTLRLLGLDPLAEGALRPGATGALGGAGAALLAEPGAVAVTEATARWLGWLSPEGRLLEDAALEVEAAGRRWRLRPAALLRGEGPAEAGLYGVLVADVAAAQEVLGRLGRVDRVDLVLPEGEEGEALARRVRALLPPDLRLEPARDSGQALGEAFAFGLRALGLLALAVGLFLVYEASASGVVQRRPLLARLRALGATRRELAALVLGEALLLGAAGAAAGLALGLLLGRGLVGLVLRTYQDLYAAVAVQGLLLDAGTLAKGLALALGGSLLAAALPAREALAVAPRELWWRAEPARLAPRALLGRALPALGLAATGALALALADGPEAAYAGAALLLLGGALTAPAVTGLLPGLLRPALAPLAGRWPLLPQAPASLALSLRRTGPAAAALAAAVAAAVGVGAMVASFRSSFEGWLEATLMADVYLRPAGGGPLDPRVLEALWALPGLEGLATVRRAQVAGPEGRRWRLRALDPHPRTLRGFRFLGPPPDRAALWAAFRAGEAVLVSEPLARRLGLAPGDRLRLPTPAGPRSFRVGAVYRDYGSEAGVVTLHAQAYRRLWGDRRVDSAALYGAPGVPARALLEAARAAAAGLQALELSDRRSLKEAARRVFERTFAAAGALQAVVTAVAAFGVAAALLGLGLERARERALLRALGAGRGELAALAAAEALCLGLAAALVALPLGLALAWALVARIQPLAFGWSLDWAPGAAPLLQGLLLALGAALAGGLPPAWRAARLAPAPLLRGE